MKVIFLDIDGVLVNRKSLMKASGMRAQADPRCVEALNAITRATGAQIVVSSTWRFFNKHMGFETPTDYMRAKLDEWGVCAHVIGCTPDLSRPKGSIYAGAERGDEIQAWLDDRLVFGNIDSFIIIDDDSDMKHLTHRLVRTNTEAGLTSDDAEKAKWMLAVDASAVIGDSSDRAAGSPSPLNES